MSNKSVRWFVTPRGTSSTENDRLAFYLERESGTKKCRLKNGKVGDVKLYEVTIAEVTKLTQGDSRFPLDFYGQVGEDIPHYHDFEQNGFKPARVKATVFRGSALLGKPVRPRRLQTASNRPM